MAHVKIYLETNEIVYDERLSYSTEYYEPVKELLGPMYRFTENETGKTGYYAAANIDEIKYKDVTGSVSISPETLLSMYVMALSRLIIAMDYDMNKALSESSELIAGNTKPDNYSERIDKLNELITLLMNSISKVENEILDLTKKK